MTEVVRRQGSEVSTAVVTPWDQAVEKFLMSLRSPSTRAAYRVDLWQWAAWAGEQSFDPLAAGRPGGAFRWHVDQWARELEDADLKPKTVARKLSALASFYGYLQTAVEEQGGSMVNPTRHVARPEVGQEFSATIALDSEELNAFLAQAHRIDERFFVGALLLASTGLRVSELLNAQVSDFAVDHGQPILFVTRKGGKRGRVSVPNKVAHVVEEHLAGRTSGYLLGDEAPMVRSTFARQADRAGRAAGLGVSGTPKANRRVTPHVLRATFATLYLDGRTANLAWLQDVMGHADSRTTRGYDRGAGALRRLAAVSNEVAEHIDLERGA